MVMSAVGPSREKLLRVQGPRSHNGCRTCKLRHVKCGEQRPHCENCIRAKRACFYVDDQPKEKPVKFVLYAAQQEPTLFPGLTHAERRSLDYFQHRAAEELSSPYRSDLWSKIILRLAQQSVPVRHAVFALSSMHEHYTRSDNSQQMLYDYSIHNYNKAIRHIVRQLRPEQSFDVMLLTSVIFCALEGLRGNFDTSLQHALAGVRIISRSHQDTHRIHSDALIPQDMLPRILLALQTQAMELGDLAVFGSGISLAAQPESMPAHFPGVEEAVHYQMSLMNEMLVWFCGLELHFQDSLFLPRCVPPELLPSLQMIQARFHAWEQAVNHIDAVSELDGNQHRGYLILKIFQAILKIVLRSLDELNASFDGFDAELGSILGLAEVFLATQPTTSSRSTADQNPLIQSAPPTSTRPVFSMSFGVVPVLFEIAVHTRNAILRGEAMRLLGICNRREGVWDSKIAYRLAQRHIDLQRDVDSTYDQSESYWRVMITDMSFSADEEIKFQYTIVPTGPHMIDSFWISGFNAAVENSYFKGEVRDAATERRRGSCGRH